MPPNLLKFASLKEQAIGNPTLPIELRLQADSDYRSDASLCNPKTGPGAADTVQFVFATRGGVKYTARTEDAFS